MSELKPCPFCGGKANIYGEEIRDYINGEWAEKTRKEFWVQPNCLTIMCAFGDMRAKAYGILGGMRFSTPEAAAREWNRMADND